MFIECAYAYAEGREEPYRCDDGTDEALIQRILAGLSSIASSIVGLSVGLTQCRSNDFAAAGVLVCAALEADREEDDGDGHGVSAGF